MSMKKKMKNFFTLTRKANGGFTLVELIVVIAILAVLAGVGIPVYSGYITKANKQADITLASEIENALMLAYYNQQLDENASVAVYYGDVDATASSEAAENAMEAAFGANWKQTLRLKYDGWNKQVGGMSLSDMFNHVNNSSFDYKDAEGGNSALNGLLNDVQSVVNVFDNYINVNNASEELKGYIGELGVTASSSKELSNGAVMFVADKISTTLTDETRAAFAKEWTTASNRDLPAFNTLSGNSLAQMAAKYAFVEAAALFVDRAVTPATPQDAWTYKLSQATADATDGSSMGVKLKSVWVDMCSAHSSVLRGYIVRSSDAESNPSLVTSAPSYKDAMAFLSYMQGVSANAESLVADKGLGGDNYFDNEDLLNYVTDYISVGENAAALGSEDVIIIQFSAKSGKVTCVPEVK